MVDNPKTDDGGRAKRVAEAAAGKVKDTAVSAAGEAGKAAKATRLICRQTRASAVE